MVLKLLAYAAVNMPVQDKTQRQDQATPNVSLAEKYKRVGPGHLGKCPPPILQVNFFNHSQT